MLVIGGDITEATAKPLIEKYFATIPKGTKAIPRPTEAVSYTHLDVYKRQATISIL